MTAIITVKSILSDTTNLIPSTPSKLSALNPALFADAMKDKESCLVAGSWNFKKRRLELEKLDKENHPQQPKKSPKKKPLNLEASAAKVEHTAQKPLLTPQYFQKSEPTCWAHFSLKNKKIVCPLPDEMKSSSDQDLIYVFENRVKQKALIGQTTALRGRFYSYLNEFNKSANGPMAEIVQDIRANPHHFRFGILHKRQAGENLDFLETEFINHKKRFYAGGLYNERNGGGGGSAAKEEVPATYHLNPNETPEKYYPIVKIKGKIRIQTSPGFHKYIRKLSQHRKPGQGLFYSVKNLKTKARYVGKTTIDKPDVRGDQHCYASEHFDKDNKEKYKPTKKDGLLHPAIGKAPSGTFGFNFMPVYPEKHPDETDKKVKAQLVKLHSSSQTENYLINLKKSKKIDGGYNVNSGGGGPVSKHGRKRKSH